MMSKKRIHFMNKARSVAELSQESNKHGAVVVKAGKIVSRGFNKFKNDPKRIPEQFIKSHCSRHAEWVAIKSAGCNIKGADIYVARINNQGVDRMSKPCPACSSLIRESGIKRVFYTEESS